MMHFKTIGDLIHCLELSEADKKDLRIDYKNDFACKVPKHFVQQIQPKHPKDPLLLQVLPRKLENQKAFGFSQDPVGDLNANPTPALLHKYQGRALLMISPRCDIHCRYCFRRHFPYENQIHQRHWQTALKQIADDSSLHEIIFSGGDPMTLSEPQLVAISQKIEAIPHVQTLRIHSRTPIVAPDQAPQKGWLNFCQHSRLKVVLVVHCNHAQELSEHTEKTLIKYRQAGVTLLNQSVLLKDINDCAETLVQLSHALFQQGVLPYYLHQLDKVEGAVHFEVSDAKAVAIMEQLRQQLPGYLVPKLVREVAGHPYKQPV